MLLAGQDEADTLAISEREALEVEASALHHELKASEVGSLAEHPDVQLARL